MNAKRWVLLCCFTTCVVTIFQFKHFINYDVRQAIRVVPRNNRHEPSIHLRQIQVAAKQFPNLTSHMTVQGPIDAKRTISLAKTASRSLAKSWWRGHYCACERPLLDYLFDIPKPVATQLYWSECFLERTVISIGHPDFKKECMGPFKISLLTQITNNRFDVLTLIANRWNGPINVAIYVKPNAILSMYTKINDWLSQNKRKNIMVHLVVAEGELYPVNWLRNLVIKNSSTEYIFMVDGDFVPSINLQETLIKQFKDLVNRRIVDTLLIVPAFEIIDSKVKRLPGTKKDLLKLLDKNSADVFHRKQYPDGHSLWKFDKWRNMKQRYFLYHMKKCSEKSEPYIAMKRAQSPFLPEILLERRKNKIAYFFELCNAGKRFAVIPNEFVVHKMHKPSSQGSKVTMCVDDAWQVFKDHIAKVHKKTAQFKTTFAERWRSMGPLCTCMMTDTLFVCFMMLPVVALICICTSRYS